MVRSLEGAARVLGRGWEACVYKGDEGARKDVGLLFCRARSQSVIQPASFGYIFPIGPREVLFVFSLVLLSGPLLRPRWVVFVGSFFWNIYTYPIDNVRLPWTRPGVYGPGRTGCCCSHAVDFERYVYV